MDQPCTKINTSLPRHPEDFKGLRVGIIGLGETGCALAEKLLNWGAEIVAVDAKPIERLKGKGRIERMMELGVLVITGTDESEELLNCDLVVLSPSVRPDKAFLQKLRNCGVVVTGEIEIVYALCKARIIAVTGTNGKTTTTSLIHHMLATNGVKAFLAGNIGTPAISVIGLADEKSWLVLEASSFQLMTCETFRPDIGVITNIAEDHLDWHKDLDEYISAKAKLLSMQRKDDYAVLNADDDGARRVMHIGAGKRILFGTVEGATHVRLLNGTVIVDIPEVGLRHVELCGLNDMKLKGKHNILNVMAALAAALLAGVPSDGVREAIRSFRGVPHRLELVGEINGIKFINDSAATTPHAAFHALLAVEARAVWIAGGKGKGLKFDILRDAVMEKVKGAVLIGSSADELASLLSSLSVPFKMAETLEDATRIAMDMADSGDVVLLSPACTSLDMFESYVERGERFKALVKELARG